MFNNHYSAYFLTHYLTHYLSHYLSTSVFGSPTQTQFSVLLARSFFNSSAVAQLVVHCTNNVGYLSPEN